MCVAHWYSTLGCGRSNLGSNPGILPILYIKVKQTKDGEQPLLNSRTTLKNYKKPSLCRETVPLKHGTGGLLPPFTRIPDPWQPIFTTTSCLVCYKSISTYTFIIYVYICISAAL